MSEKIERRWRINSRAVLEVLYEGRWETAGTRWTYPDNGHNQRFAEAVADACGDIDALTSERDEAVREAGALRALLRDFAVHDWPHCSLNPFDCDLWARLEAHEVKYGPSSTLSLPLADLRSRRRG